MAKEYYGILGLSRGASQDEVRAGYRRMAHKWHPQRNPNDIAAAETEFQRVAEAYDVLSDLPKGDESKKKGYRSKKAIYDEYGIKVFTEGTQNFPGYQYVGDPLKQFKEFFASDSAFVPLTQGDSILNMRERVPPRKKEDPLDLKLNVTLEELYTGATKLVKYRRTRLADDRITTQDESTTLTVEVTAGWKNGTIVTFEKAGNQTHPAIPQGDVRLTVVTQPHPHFARMGADLIYTHKLMLTDALCDHSVRVKLLNHETISVPVAEVTTSTSEKRVIGRGMPLTTGGHGDLVVKFDIQFPKELNSTQKEQISSVFA